MVQPDREGREEEDPDEGTIVDPRIIAERRARRAELAEDALHDRAIAAERQLAHAQQQLEFAHDQRIDLAARLKQAERDLRAAQQGEYAEAQRREEIEEDATAARREDERELSSLRKALERAQEREQELEDELARVRRAAQRTQQDSRTALAAAVQDSGSEDRAAAEVTLLQHELDRRVRIQKDVARQLVLLRAELERTQLRLRTDTERTTVSDAVLDELGSTALTLRDELRGLEEQRGEVERRLAGAQARIAERDAQLAQSARRLADVESALQEIRAQVDGASADLRMTVADHAQQQVRLDAAELAMTTAEQRAREAAEELEAERLQRAQVESDLRMTIAEELRSRERLEADIKRSLATLTDELAEVRVENAGRTEREAQLEALANELIATAGRDQLSTAVTDVGRQLEAEREERRQAETRIVELEDELEQARVALRPLPPMPPADHPALQEPAGPQAGGEGDADSVIIDLARAAARLRTPVDGADPVDLGRAEDEGTLRTDAEPEATADEDAADGGDVDDHPAGTPEQPDDPSSRPTLPEVQIGRRADSAGPRAPSPWLTTAIAALALRDAAAAAGLIQALLPVQGARLRQDLAYDLAIAGHPELRVQLRADGSTAVMQRAAAGAAAAGDARIAGSAESLTALVAGGTKRRLPAGVSVTGKRRRARRLARAMRPAVGLSAVSAAGIELPVRLTLQLLADVIQVPVADDQRFTVAFAEEAGPVQAHVVACDDAPLQVHEGAPAHAAATVRVPAGRLGAFLAGDAGARVQGDVAVVGRLLTWADAAQGLDIRRRP